MELIYYRGLNCYLACIINIANLLGADYLNAFSTLWSETEFKDEPEYNIYTSKRVFANLNDIGIITQSFVHSTYIENIMAQLMDGELFFIGTDMFYIPWHPVYGHFHGPHYFFAQKENAASILCFDPVYGEQNTIINPEEVLSSAFEIGRVHKADAKPHKNMILKEATAVLRSHPKTKERLLYEIVLCRNEGKPYIDILIKQINAMINNRYLFGHFLNSAILSLGHCYEIFDDNYYVKWEAVRNGLYKASILKENSSVIDEVCELFISLMDEEMNMAKEIITLSLSTKGQVFEALLT